MADDDTQHAEGKKTRIATSAKMPSATPDATTRVVSKLSELAGPTSRERLASALGVALTGGVARALSSSLLYGFVKLDSDKKLNITDRGNAFVGDDADASKQAAREGLMVTGFGPLIKRLSTRNAAEDVIAVRLQEDQGLDATASEDRAKLLVKAGTAAGLIVNSKFDGGVIEDTIAVVGEPDAPKPAEAPAAKPKPAAKPAAASTPPAAPTPPPAGNAGSGGSGGGEAEQQQPPAPFQQAAGTPLQVVLHIDASKLDAKEIGAIVRELRGSATVSTSGS
jgi:hypothetical protein